MTNEEIVREACRVIWSEGHIERLRDDKIIEQRGLTDHFALYQQLGLVDMAG